MRPGGEGPDIRYYIGILLARWWLILLFLMLGAGSGLVYFYLATPIFRAGCRVEIIQDPRLNFEQATSRSAAFLSDQEINRRAIILQSGLLRNQVREALVDEWRSQLPENGMSARVNVTQVRGVPTMMDIGVDAIDQKYALAYLTTLLTKYEDQRRAEILIANENSLASLKQERDSVFVQLQKAQDDLAAFLSAHSIQLNETKALWDERFLASLIQRQNALRIERAMLEAQFTMLDKLSAGTIQEVVDLSIETHHATLGHALLGTGAPGEKAVGLPTPILREQADWQTRELELARLEAEKAEMAQTFKPDHPKMREVARRIEDVSRDLKLTAEMAMKRLQERHRAVAIQEDALDDAINAWRAQLNLTVAEQAQYQTLNATVENLKKLNDAVYSRWLEGSVLNIDAVFSRQVERPAGHGMIWPNRTKVMGMALAGALAIGVALCFLLHHFDTTLLDIAAVEQRFALPYVSGIPHWSRLLKTFTGNRNLVIVTREKTNVATEVYRTVRGTLEHLIGDHPGCFTMAITSSDSGDGKSLTALNLAVVLAWTGKRVLLVDGDLRRGALHKALDRESGNGFTELLTGNVAYWRDTVQKGVHENLDFLSSGQYVQESPEQLGSQRFRELMAQWRQEYDMVIFDTAPVSRVMDTSILARQCDGVLLVARFAKTRMAELQHLLRRLEGTRILGFCVNCIDFHRLSKSYYGYSGYYGYGYRDYGYGYYRYYAYYRPYGDRKGASRSKRAATTKAS
ncbi:MAG: polysaccharide biosynthesis tyrosine autokinase [Lentisphaeria bacterium]|nr:polysaccharide biosynthesis tyrosine autokinase [Lentisphaeria bacterium]